MHLSAKIVTVNKVQQNKIISNTWSSRTKTFIGLLGQEIGRWDNQFVQCRVQIRNRTTNFDA